MLRDALGHLLGLTFPGRVENHFHTAMLLGFTAMGSPPLRETVSFL
jgi:hypothetical protein